MNKQAILEECRERMFVHTNRFGMKNAAVFMEDIYEILTAHEGVELYVLTKHDGNSTKEVALTDHEGKDEVDEIKIAGRLYDEYWLSEETIQEDGGLRPSISFPDWLNRRKHERDTSESKTSSDNL